MAAAGIVAAMVAVATAAVVVIAAAAAFVAATVVVASATAAVGGLKLFGGGVAHCLYLAFEAYVLAGEGVVEVHHHLFVGDFLYEAVDAETVGRHHRDEGAGLYHLGVKFAVDHEYILFERDYLLDVVRAESLVGLGCHIVCGTGLHTVERFFQRLDHAAGDTEYKFLGIFRINLMNEFLRAVRIYLI